MQHLFQKHSLPSKTIESLLKFSPEPLLPSHLCQDTNQAPSLQNNNLSAKQIKLSTLFNSSDECCQAVLVTMAY